PLASKFRSYADHVLVKLEGSRPEEEINDVAFVRLQPVQLDRRYRSDVQPVDIRRVEERALKSPVRSDRRADESRSDGVDHLVLGALHDGDKGEHVFLAGNSRLGRIAEDDGWPEISAAFFLHQAVTVFGSQVMNARGLEILVNVVRDRLSLTRDGEGGQ